MLTEIPLTKACAGLADLQRFALADHLAWLGPGVLAGQHPMRAWEYALAVEACARWTSATKTSGGLILDVGGSGSQFGPTLAQLLGPQWQVELVDPKETYALEHRVILENTSLRPAQVIFSISTIEHVPDPSGFLEALARNLAPGGLAFLTMDGKGDEGPDTQHFHWMRERIYTPALWTLLAAEAESLGLTTWGGADWTYHGHQVYDYSFLSLCLRKFA